MPVLQRPLGLFLAGFVLGVSLLLPLAAAADLAHRAVSAVVGSPPGPPLGTQAVQDGLAAL